LFFDYLRLTEILHAQDLERWKKSHPFVGWDISWELASKFYDRSELPLGT
jgi:hypothetical protein